MGSILIYEFLHAERMTSQYVLELGSSNIKGSLPFGVYLRWQPVVNLFETIM